MGTAARSAGKRAEAAARKGAKPGRRPRWVWDAGRAGGRPGGGGRARCGGRGAASRGYSPAVCLREALRSLPPALRAEVGFASGRERRAGGRVWDAACGAAHSENAADAAEKSSQPWRAPLGSAGGGRGAPPARGYPGASAGRRQGGAARGRGSGAALGWPQAGGQRRVRSLFCGQGGAAGRQPAPSQRGKEKLCS